MLSGCDFAAFFEEAVASPLVEFFEAFEAAGGFVETAFLLSRDLLSLAATLVVDFAFAIPRPDFRGLVNEFKVGSCIAWI